MFLSRASCYLLLSVLLPLTAMSQDIPPETPEPTVHDYSLVSIGLHYVEYDVEGFEENAHGLSVSGSTEINERFHLWGTVSASRFDVDYADVTSSAIGLGVGAHLALAEKASAYARVGYIRAETEVEWDTGYGAEAAISTDGDGYLVSVGIRTALHPQLELIANTSLTSVEDESDTGFGVDLVYNLTRKVALGVGVSVADDAVATTLGTVIYFQ